MIETVERLMKQIGADPNSMVRTQRAVRVWIEDQQDGLAAANTIITTLGGTSTIDKFYNARIVASHMFIDCVKNGSDFNPGQSYEDGVWKAKQLRRQSGSLAEHEEKQMEAATAMKKAGATGKKVVPGVKVPTVKAAKAKEKEAKGPTILANGRERGSMRIIARKIFLDNENDSKAVVKGIMDALNCSKTNAYTHIYLVKQELKKNPELRKDHEKAKRAAARAEKAEAKAEQTTITETPAEVNAEQVAEIGDAIPTPDPD